MYRREVHMHVAYVELSHLHKCINQWPHGNDKLSMCNPHLVRTSYNRAAYVSDCATNL